MKWNRRKLFVKFVFVNLPGDSVTTTEETSNLLDQILKSKPIIFKIYYMFDEKKILKSIIDTIPGFAKTSEFNYRKLNDFKDYCAENGLQDGKGMTKEGAITLKESLITYKNSH